MEMESDAPTPMLLRYSMCTGETARVDFDLSVGDIREQVTVVASDALVIRERAGNATADRVSEGGADAPPPSAAKLSMVSDLLFYQAAAARLLGRGAQLIWRNRARAVSEFSGTSI